ncbi:MAG: 30S ribosomal protein S6e [Candidatus Anstonellales archaeon]
MKIVVGTKQGKAYSKELSESEVMALRGKKIGDEIDGGMVGLPGYILVITGGSDSTGAPMRADVKGAGSSSAFLSPGVGFRGKKGERKRKRIRGNIVGEDISQLNCIVKQEGIQKLDELMPKQEKKEGGKEGD